MEAFSRLTLLSFRDHSLSKSIVKAYGLSGVPNEVVFDEAFTLATGPEAEAKEYLSTCGLPENASFLAIHFRSTDYTQETTSFLPRISDLLDKIIDAHGHYLVFFPMSYHTHSRMDEEFGQRIRAGMGRPDRVLVARLSTDVTIVKGAVGRARYSLGLSYHLHIFSLSFGHPAVILYTGEYYKCKSEGLVGFYGLPNAAIDLAEAPDSEILRHLAGLEDDYAGACQAVARVNEELLKRNDWTLRELARIRDSW
jgi:polysaccharide pyruvyl transferase WcaK-like protein